MKKITLGLLFCLAMVVSNAQTDCANAAALNLGAGGTNTVASYGTDIPTPDCNTFGTPTGAAWFIYTPTQTGVLNLNSDINAGLDTTVNVYTGTCAVLTCEGNADDISYPSNLATDGNFDVTANTTYYIVWDNRWDATNSPFDFIATFTAVTGPPNQVSTPSPVDMATNVAIDPTDGDNAVPLSWVPDNTSSPATEYDILYGTDPAALNNLTANATYTNTAVTITGNNYSTTYYWSIVAINSSGSTQGPIWSFTTEDVASVDENKIEFFTLSPNPANTFVELKSDFEITGISIYNALGQNLLKQDELNQNRVDISSLSSGTYFINAVSEKGSQTVQFIKQ